LLYDAVPYILHHHEKWDGTGYPNGLKGKDIPVEARLLAIVDVYDALTSERPYRGALSNSEVIDFMQSNSEIHFDPDITPVFLKLIRAGKLK
jgi:HD-GYP domain-containing protein (c-di-GMP phosphodiesterase class II)